MTTKNRPPIRVSHKLFLATLLLSFACGPSASDIHDAKDSLEKIRADKKVAEAAAQEAARKANPCPGKWFFDLHVVCPAQDNPNLNVRCMSEPERRYSMLPGTGGTPYRGLNGHAFTVPVKMSFMSVYTYKDWRDSKEKCDKSRELVDKKPEYMANSECSCLEGPDTRTGFWPRK